MVAGEARTRVVTEMDLVKEKFDQGIQAMDTQVGKLKQSYTEFGGKATESMAGMEDQMAGMSRRTMTFNQRLKHGSQVMRGFTMQLLGIMFFGMSVQRLFQGMLQPALELFGVFDIWQVMLQSLFIPLMEIIMPIFLRFTEFVINLSDSTKLAIGKFVLFMFALGTILMVVGILGLGLGSLISLIANFGDIIGAIIPDVDILGVSMSGFIEAGLLIGAVKLAWQGLKSVVNSVMDRFLELDFVKTLLEKLGVEVDGQKTPWEILKETIANVIGTIKDELDLGEKFSEVTTTMTNWKVEAMKLFGEVKQGLINTVAEVFGLEASFDSFSGVFTAIKEDLEFDDLLQDIKDIVDEVTIMLPTIKDIATAMETVVGWASDFVGFIRTAQEIVDKIFAVIAPTEKDVKDLPRGTFPFSPFKYFRDFIYRPGQKPIAISPDDTVVGFKKGMPGGGTVVNITNNFMGFTMDELRRQVDGMNGKIVDDVRRIVGQTR